MKTNRISLSSFVVGSYVVSFFKNAKASQLPEFETLRRIASTFDLPEKRFERNDYRQSKHIQFTQQIERLDLGAQVEADLVFDEQKQLRNVRARFDLNKEHLQLKSFEVTVRQNGLPEVAQQMLQELTRQTNLNAIVEQVKDLASIRSKHELNRKINKLVKLFNLNKINLNNRRLSEQIDASIHVRIEDKTVLYLNMKDIQEYASTLEQQLNKREQIVDQIVDSLTGDNAITFILSSKQHRMPTGHGLPVHSGYSMVMVAGLKIENGAFYPSIATDFHYEMGFTVMNVRPAVHYHVQMHSAPGLKVNVEHQNGVPTKLSVSMPENRLEIIAIKSIVKLQTATEEIELNHAKKERNGCTRVFNKILGVELCQRTVYPRNLVEKNAINALFNGPIEFSLYLEKTDASIRHWEIVAQTPFGQRAGQSKSLHLAFNTVGSRTNREVSAKIELQNEKDSKVVYIDLKTPVKSAKIETRAQWTEKYVGLKTALVMDNSRFEVEIGGERTNENGEQLYRPSVKLVIPGRKKIHYTGKVALVNSGKKENFQIELRDSTTNKPLIKASVVKSGKIDFQETFKLATDLQAFWFTGSSIRFVSNIDKSSNGITTDLEAIHTVSRQSPTTYKWKVALNDLSNSENSKYNADFELSVPNTEFENVALSWNFVNKANQEVEQELTGFWNNKNGQKTRQVHVLQQSKLNKASAKISSLNENLLKIEIVPLSVNYELQAKTNWQRSQQKYNVQLTARDVQTNKQYKGEMSYQMPEVKPLKMNLEARIMIENNEFKIVHNIEEQESQQYHGRTMVQLRQGQHVEFNYVYRMKEHSLKVPRLNHELDAEIRIPSKSITIKHKSALKLNANQFELKHSLRSNNAVVSDVKIVLDKNAQSQLLIDNQLFQVKFEGDLTRSTSQKQINVFVQSKQHQLNHQTKLTWSGRKQIKLDSKTTKNQQQIADVLVDYSKNEKIETRITIEKLGKLVAKHQPNGQQWATVEIESDYFSKPIRQEFAIEKQSNKKYMIRSKTRQNQQIVGELDLEIGSQSSLKLAAFDWKITGRSTNQELFNFSLENAKKQLKEDVEIEYRNQVGRISLKHLDAKQRTTSLVGQVSPVEESKLQFENERANVEFSMKPTGQAKHVRLTVNDKKNNVQHKSELKHQESTLYVVLEHTKDNQVIVKHNSKLSLDDDSFSKTETRTFEIEAVYKRRSAVEVKFSHQNGLRHSTNIEIVDLRNKIARIHSNTMKQGKQILNLDINVDSLKKIDIKAANEQDNELTLNVNLKDHQKRADLQVRSGRFEINSKWNKESHKDQKYNLDIVDKKYDSKYNVLAHHQRKTMLHIKVERSSNGQTKSGELKLHKNGEAFFKLDGKDMKLKSELDFARSPVQATVQFESRKHSIKHETVVSFMQQENELKIKSKTEKNSRQIANVDFRLNPTTKQIFASGEVDNKNLKIEGNVNKRFSIELNNLKSSQQFRHLTELDLSSRTLRSETVKDNQQVHKAEARLTNRRDVDGSISIKEHELVFKLNENANQLELNYNNNKIDVRSTGFYKIDRKSISVQINAQQKSRQVVDFGANLRINDKSFDAKLNAFQTASSVKFELSGRKQVRATVNFENQERQVKRVQFTIDTISSSEKQIAAKIHTQNWKIEKQLRLINGQQLKINGQVERNGKQLVQADVEIAKPFKVEGKVNFNTQNLKGQASVQTVNDDEIQVEFTAKNGQEKKIADIKSKLTKRNNKLVLDIDFDGQTTGPYTMTSEWNKESDQLTMNTIVKSKGQKVGKLDARIRVDGLTFDAKLEGDLTVSGRRSEIVYKLSNLNSKFEHVFKIQKANNYSYGYDISVHLRQGKFIIHLPNRIVEVRYDVTSQTNGHVLLNVEVLPNSQHQPNNIYAIKFDNLITMNDQELILDTQTTVHHPEIQHPIEMHYRIELRQLTHQRPLVIFVSYDASSNQQNRISGLFEILNENNVRVAHINISHQDQPIFDVHYRWAINQQLVHQQLAWTIAGQNVQRQTGELLAQINLKQKQAKFELNNKHKLQVNWEKNFDRNTIVQIKAQTDNLVRKTKIMTNNREKQIEITNYENERIVSNYIVSVLKEKNTLFAVEMHKKQGSKLEKVAFIQLVKDSLNYAKVHLKAEKSLVYEIEKNAQVLNNKARSLTKRHANEISAIFKQQYRNMKLDEQTENTSRFARKAAHDLIDIAADYTRLLQQYLPGVFETVNTVYQSISQHLRNVWNVNMEERISQIINEIFEQVQRAQSMFGQWKETVEYKIERMSEQIRSTKDKFSHELIVKLSNQFEESVKDAIRFTEDEGEKVYEFFYRSLRHLNMEKVVKQLRKIIVNVKNQIKQTRVHENLHKLYNYQTKFEGKWDLRGDGEIIGKIYYPSKWLN